MKVKDIIQPSLYVQNLLIKGSTQQTVDNYEKKVRKKQKIKLFEDRKNLENIKNNKIDKIYHKLQPLQNKYQNQTISIDYKYVDSEGQADEDNVQEVKNQSEKYQNQKVYLQKQNNFSEQFQKKYLKNSGKVCLVFDDDENEQSQQDEVKEKQNFTKRQKQQQQQFVSTCDNKNDNINNKENKKNFLLMEFDDSEESKQQDNVDQQKSIYSEKCQNQDKQSILETQPIQPKKIYSNFCSSSDEQNEQTHPLQNNHQDRSVRSIVSLNHTKCSKQQTDVQILKPLNINQLLKSTENILDQPIPEGYIIQTIVKRNLQSKDKVFYEMFDTSTFKSILQVKKGIQGFEIGISKNLRSASLLNSKNNKSESMSYQKVLVISNFFGTEFNCFKINQKQQNQEQISLKKFERLMTIEYESNLFGLNGPRKMEIYIPQINYSVKGQKNLHQIYDCEMKKVKDGTKNPIKKFVNKYPRWDHQLAAYVLNFNGRATVSSVKNFIITKDFSRIDQQRSVKMSEVNQPNHILFGKIQKNIFNLDIKYPFSLAQAMALALSSFDKKFGCE